MRKYFFFLFVFFIQQIGTAQQFTSLSSTIPTSSNSKYIPADFDSDGDMDVFMTGYLNNSNVCRIYTNNAGVFTLNTSSLTALVNGFGAWGDYDNDGDLDLFYAGNNASGTSISKLYNNANGVFTSQSTGIIGFGTGTCNWIDYDNDGDLDLFVSANSASDGAAGPKPKIYQNNNGAFTLVNPNITSYLATTAWGDYDKDGDADLVGINSIGDVKLYNNNNGVLQLSNYTFVSAGSQPNILWADINADGYLDLLFGGLSTIAYYKNLNGTFVNANTNIPNGGSYLSVADFDDDGDLDLLRHSYSYNMSIFTNINGTFSPTNILKTFTGTNGNTLSANIFDVNADSKIDVELIYGGANNGIFRNDNTTNNAPPNAINNTSTIINANDVIISWNKTTDDSTDVNGLSYNIRVGTTPYADNIISDHSNSLNGRRELLEFGNAYADTFKVIKGLSQGKYYYQIQAIDAAYKGSAFSVIDSFEINVIDIPVLNYPSYNQVELPLQFFCNWNAVAGATDYYVDVATDTLFNNMTVNNTLTTDTFFAITNLTMSTKYFWRVRAHSANGTSGNSSIWTFRSLYPFYASAVGINTISNGSAEFADYDSDGDIDYVVAGRTSNTTAISELKNKFGNTYNSTNIGFTAGCIGTSTRFVDYDNDNDLDAFFMGREIANSNYNYSRTIVNNVVQYGTYGLNLNNYGLIDGCIDFADYDHDGDLDAALFGKDAPYNFAKGYLFQNNGQGDFNLKDTLRGFRYSSCAWGDYDNDGDADLLVAGESYADSAKTALYNNVNGNLVALSNQPFVEVKYADVNWGDFDNDGDLDILISGFAPYASNSATRIYQNNNGVFSLFTSLPNVFQGTCDWVDYDSDGDLDVFLMSTSTYNTTTNNASMMAINNNGVFTLTDAGIASFGSSRSTWADYDDDGDMDLYLVSANQSSSNTNFGKLYINRMVSDTNYINTIPQAPTSTNVSANNTTITCNWNDGVDNETPAATLSYNIAVGDKPYADNFLASHANIQTGFNRLAELGNAQHAHTKTIINLPYGNYFVSVQSVDQQYRSSSWKIDSVYVLNPNAPTLSYPYNKQQNLFITNQLRWKPFQNAVSYHLEIAYDSLFNQIFETHDNVVDTFYTQSNFINYEQFYWRVSANLNNNTTTATSLVWSFFVNVKPILSNVQLPASWVNDFDWGDVDNDGDKDYLFGSNVTSSGGHAYVLRNNQTYFDTLYVANYNAYAPYGIRLKFADINNDNKLDFVTSGEQNNIARIYYNTGTSFTTDSLAVIGLPTNGFNGGNLDFGDYDNDGDLDLLCNGISGNSIMYQYGYPKVWRNDNGHFTGMNFNIHSMQEGDCKWVDIDGDGDLDISMHGANNSSNNAIISRIYRNDVDSFRAVSTIIPNSVLTRGSLSWSDYDLDGDADLLMVAQGGNNWPLRLYKNNGGFNFSLDTTVSPTFNAYNYGEATWGDYDNDGDADILLTVTSALFNDTAIADVLKNNQGSFEPIYTGMTKAKFAKCAMVDVDNDHDLDLFYTGTLSNNSTNTISRLYLNQSRANQAPNTPQGLMVLVDSANNFVLKWNKATDAETGSIGLTYNVSLTTSTAAPYYISPMSDSASNYLFLSWQGNAGLDTFYVLRNLPTTNYLARVQAVDNTYEASAWSNAYLFNSSTVNLKSENITKEMFTLFPNPSHDFIFLKPSFYLENANLRIIDVLGNTIFTDKLSTQHAINESYRINMQQFVNGIYFIIVQSNSKEYILKMVKN